MSQLQTLTKTADRTQHQRSVRSLAVKESAVAHLDLQKLCPSAKESSQIARHEERCANGCGPTYCVRRGAKDSFWRWSPRYWSRHSIPRGLPTLRMLWWPGNMPQTV